MITATSAGARIGGSSSSSSNSSGELHLMANDPSMAAGGGVAVNNTNMTTSHLQSRLTQLKSQSQNLSNELTKRLATSRSGQSLLNIGPSLSTLPPDLSSLLEAISPLLQDVELYEKENCTELTKLVNQGREVQMAIRKRTFALECAEIYRDLVLGEDILHWDEEYYGGDGPGSRRKNMPSSSSSKSITSAKNQQQKFVYGNEEEVEDYEEDDDDSDDVIEETLESLELDHASSLERVAYTALYLLQELQSSSEGVSTIAMMGSSNTATTTITKNTEDALQIMQLLPSLKDDSNSSSSSGINSTIIEKSKYLMKLSPRIRRLESDAVKCLVGRLESALIAMRNLSEEKDGGAEEDDKGVENQHRQSRQKSILLLTIGHYLRGLALLQKGHEAESTFARIAIMPIIRSRLSMGKLDEGGLRGECAGLFFLLDDIANTIKEVYGDVLRLSEGMFAYPEQNDCAGDRRDVHHPEMLQMEVDLVTCGVWVPVATALMADTSIKMAIFSPGIANVLQANYSALETFISELASSLLTPPPSSISAMPKSGGSTRESVLTTSELDDFSHLYYEPKMNSSSIERAQTRLYSHPTTVEYYKRWNLPIYYQLRFAEFTKRLDAAVQRVQKDGWQADVFSGNEVDSNQIRETLGFELPIFVELYDILLTMWKSTIFLRPLTHRFLRGAVQLIGRILTFVKDGLDGKIEFGGGPNDEIMVDGKEKEEGSSERQLEAMVKLPSYCWNERVDDIAMVSWELTILETVVNHNYAEVIANTVCPSDGTGTEYNEIKALASEILLESSQEIAPLVLHSWNALIINNLTALCCTPISAVKGVAATYRMTNRPPPTQASPFVATILRPLQEFDTAYASRTPPQIGDDWKRTVISSVSDKYSMAVEELIATVKRTEEALKSRTSKRMMAGGMSDGEKVKLQLFLDYAEFRKHVNKLLGIDDASSASVAIGGLVKLGQLTREAEDLLDRQGVGT